MTALYLTSNGIYLILDGWQKDQDTDWWRVPAEFHKRMKSSLNPVLTDENHYNDYPTCVTPATRFLANNLKAI